MKSAYSLYQQADDAWRKELRRVFHGRAIDALQCAKLNRGGPGSNLRLLYENRDAARLQWENETFGAKVQNYA